MRLANTFSIGYWVLLHSYQTLVYIKNIFSFSKKKQISASLAKVQPKNRAVVICGGPSFDRKMINYILNNRDELDVYAVNFYCCNDVADTIVPDYYVLSDPHNFVENPPAHLISKNARLVEYLSRHDPVLAVPYGCRLGFEATSSLFFNDDESLMFGGSTPLNCRGYRSNTSAKAISIAKHFDYDEIIVCGFDYNYPQKIRVQDGKVYLIDEHHYGVEFTDYSIYYESVAHALNWWSYDYYYFSKLRDERIRNYSNLTLIDVFTEFTFDE